MALDIKKQDSFYQGYEEKYEDTAEAALLFIEYAEADLGIDFSEEEEEDILEWYLLNTDDDSDNDVDKPILDDEDGDPIDLDDVLEDFNPVYQEGDMKSGDRFDEDGNPIAVPEPVILPIDDLGKEEKRVEKELLANRADLSEAYLEALLKDPPDLATARLLERTIRETDKAREELRSMADDRNQEAIDRAAAKANALVNAAKSGTSMVQTMVNSISDMASDIGKSRENLPGSDS